MRATARKLKQTRTARAVASREAASLLETATDRAFWRKKQYTTEDCIAAMKQYLRHGNTEPCRRASWLACIDQDLRRELEAV